MDHPLYVEWNVTRRIFVLIVIVLLFIVQEAAQVDESRSAPVVQPLSGDKWFGFAALDSFASGLLGAPSQLVRRATVEGCGCPDSGARVRSSLSGSRMRRGPCPPFSRVSAFCVHAIGQGKVQAVTKFAADGFTYGLAPGACVEGQCAPVVQLLSGEKLLDSAALDFAASGAVLLREEGYPGFTGFIPLEAWTAGSGEGAVTTALQLVRLTSSRTGLLVHQAAGYEHVKQRHDLFVTDGAKLKRAWSAIDGPGPWSSAAEVVSTDNGQADEVIYLEGFSPGGAEPDTLMARRLVWDETKQELTEQPLAKLPAVIAGEFPNAKAARQMQAAAGPCLAYYWVLPANLFGRPPSEVVVALIAARAQDVAPEMDRECDGGLARHSAEFQPLPAMQ